MRKRTTLPQKFGPANYHYRESGPLVRGFAGYALSKLRAGERVFLPVANSEEAQILAVRLHAAARNRIMAVRTQRGPSAEGKQDYGLHVWLIA